MSTEVREKPAGKHDSFIETQLARAESRIRLVDLSAALLGFLAGTLAYAVAMILLDRLFALSDATRQVGLLIYLVGAAAYLGVMVVRPLMWRVNPYYAARQLEQTLPGSRNHVVNWIDLHGQKLPAIIKLALGQRAAKDLSRTDVDRAIANTRALVTGSVAGLFAAIFIVLFLLLGPAPFQSLLARAFAPFGRTIATRTQVSILRPQGGDAVVNIGSPVTIVAEVGGRVPDPRDKDAPCLLYRHDPSEPYRQRYLQYDESTREWAATIGSEDVRDGFWYRVTAGDASTEEHHIQARATPNISRFLATYHYRPYVGRADRSQTTRNLEALRGTEVTLRIGTNRTATDGRLDLEPTEGGIVRVPGERDPADPQALRFRLVLEQSGKYRIRFSSSEGETYVDPAPFDVVVLPDNAPQVRITHPAKDVSLPAGGHLEIKGNASDDFGIARLELCLQVVGGQKLRPYAYLADKLGKPGFGTPRTLNYQYLLELATLADEKGQPVKLTPGTKVEYWLEAADGCDFPRPNVARSEPRWKITIAEGKENEKQRQDRQQARQRQKENEKKQEEQIKKEAAEREKKRQQEQKQEKEDQAKRDKDQAQAKKDDQNNEPKNEEPKNDPGAGGKGNPDDQKRDQETGDKANDLKNQLDQREQGNKGEGKDGKDKDGKSDKGEGKEGGKGKSDGQDGKPGENAQGGDGKGKASEGKDGKNKPGETGKPDGKEPSTKKEAGQPGSKPGKSKQPPQPDKGGKETGERKPESGPKPGDKEREGKGRDTDGQAAGDAKPGQKPRETQDNQGGKPGECKGPGDKGGQKGSEGKKGEQGQPGKQPGQSRPNPGGPKGNAGEGKPGGASGNNGKKGPKPEDASAADVAQAKKELENGDAEARRQAAQNLKDIQDKGKDGETREAARQAIEEAKKKGQLDKDGMAPGAKDGPQGDKDKGPGKPGEGNSGEKPQGGKPEPGQVKGPKGTPGGTNPGGGGDRRGSAGSGDSEEPPRRNQKPAPHRASMMQLEEFKKKVDKDILKNMKMSRQQFQQFLKDYADLARRQQAEKDDPESLPGASRKGSLNMTGGRAIKGRSDAKPGDVRNEGRPKPPPGYRDPYNEMLKLLNRPQR